MPSLYDSGPGNGSGPFLQPWDPHGARTEKNRLDEVQSSGAVCLPMSGIVDEHCSKAFVEKDIRPDAETHRYTRADWNEHWTHIILPVYHFNTRINLTAIFQVNLNLVPSVLRHCWLGVKKGIQPIKNDEVLAWLSVWSEEQMICIWSSWCHYHPTKGP